MKYKRRYNSGTTVADECVVNLCSEIILQAVNDWRELIKRRVWDASYDYRNYEKSNRGNFAEIRRFFKSTYCETMCEICNTSAIAILEKLESELNEAQTV